MQPALSTLLDTSALTRPLLTRPLMALCGSLRCSGGCSLVQGGKLTFVYIASPEEDGDDLETGTAVTWHFVSATSSAEL